MAKRRKTSGLEDFVEVISLFPWWVGVALAVVLYLVLHVVAAPEPAGPAKVGQMSGLVASQFIHVMARIGQYVLPFFCLVAAAISATRSRSRKQLHDSVAKSPDQLAGIGWQQFEQLVGESFRRLGFTVVENGGAGPDDGVDLLLRKAGEKYLVQCKQWRAQQVGVPVVRELYGAMAAVGATGGYVVTSGRFTTEAREFAEGRNIWLVDGDELRDWMQQAGKPAAKVTKPMPVNQVVPHCPVCDSVMVERTAKKGANAGNRFWGCPRYPECRGTRDWQ